MKAVVSGTLRMQNGLPPTLHANLSGIFSSAKDFQKNSEFKLIIAGGHVFVELDSDNLDLAVRTARNIVDSVLLTAVLRDGAGLTLTIEFCKIGDTIGHVPQDYLEIIPQLPFDFFDAVQLMGRNEQVRYALRDYNQGLFSREDSPLYFYRAIETMAKAILEVDDIKNQWDVFHSRIGTTRKDMETIEALNGHRHGEHTPFTAEQHIKMMTEGRTFMLKSLEYLLRTNSKQSPPIS